MLPAWSHQSPAFSIHSIIHINHSSPTISGLLFQDHNPLLPVCCASLSDFDLVFGVWSGFISRSEHTTLQVSVGKSYNFCHHTYLLSSSSLSPSIIITLVLLQSLSGSVVGWNIRAHSGRLHCHVGRTTPVPRCVVDYLWISRSASGRLQNLTPLLTLTDWNLS